MDGFSWSPLSRHSTTCKPGLHGPCSRLGLPGEGGRVCAHVCVHLCANTAERTGQAKAAGPLCLKVQPKPPGAWDIWDLQARALPTRDPKEP